MQKALAILLIITSATLAADHALAASILQVSAPLASEASADRAKAWLRSALEAMGGEARIRGIKTLSLKGNGHTHLLEQSERPEGPWIVTYEGTAELRDLQEQRLRQDNIVHGFPNASESTLIVSDGIAGTTFKFNGQTSPMITAPADEAIISLSPERMLLTALDAAELHAEVDVGLQRVSHHVVTFNWHKIPVRIFLNSYTSLPTAIETVRAYPYDGFWGVWGDVRTRTYFSLWTLEPGGIHYPRQWDIERNDQPYRSITVTDLVFNATLPADAFAIPGDVRKALAARPPMTINDRPLGRPNRPAQEIAPNVILIPGTWNVTLVRQSDGVVIVEAPISSGYSARVIAETARRFPGVPIKAVISTSDSWPHLGGVRKYVARGIPVFGLDLNRSILQRLVSTPHVLDPDSLTRSHRRMDLRIVSRKTVIGSGPNRLEIYPIRTETGERMMAVYFPEHHLLYGSDLVQGGPNGPFFMPQYLAELMDAVRREKLVVDTVFAMHSGPTPWARITAAVAQAGAETARP